MGRGHASKLLLCRYITVYSVYSLSPNNYNFCWNNFWEISRVGFLQTICSVCRLYVLSALCALLLNFPFKLSVNLNLSAARLPTPETVSETRLCSRSQHAGSARWGQEGAAQMNFNGEVFHRMSDYSYLYRGSFRVLLFSTEHLHFNTFGKTLPAMIPLSAVPSSTRTRNHNAILFIDTTTMLGIIILIH